jgi:hypothetical protein
MAIFSASEERKRAIDLLGSDASVVFLVIEVGGRDRTAIGGAGVSSSPHEIGFAAGLASGTADRLAELIAGHFDGQPKADFGLSFFAGLKRGRHPDAASSFMAPTRKPEDAP